MPTRVSNPTQRYSNEEIEWIDAPLAELEIYQERARSIISHNDSPDVGFECSVNPYRGCFHACAYCYARRTHPYIDFGAGTDFERKIVVKVNAAELLRKEFLKKRWRGQSIVFSGVTDCYQPLELSYALTRQCLQICAEFRNPVAIITKGAIILRDIDVLTELHRHASIEVFHSIAFADDAMSQKVEPGAPRPSTRFRAMECLAKAGIPVSVGIAPVILGLNDSQVAQILERASGAGAKRAFFSLLRLPGEVRDVFIERLQNEFPLRANKVINQMKEARGGELNSLEFGKRMHGEGERWNAVKWLFNSSCEKFGLNRVQAAVERDTFRRPQKQMSLGF